MKLIFSVLLLGLCQKGTDAATSFIPSAGTLTDEGLQVCPGTTISIICSHEGADDLTRWMVTHFLPMDCNEAVNHVNDVINTATCGPFTVNMISLRNESTRMSTLVLPVTESLNGAVVTCFAGSSTSSPQVGNLTIQVIGSPSPPTVDNMTYFVVDSATGRFRFLVSSSGTFGTDVNISVSVVGGGGSVDRTGDEFIITGLNYTGSHTISVLATSAVCPGVDNSIDVIVKFNITTPVLTRPSGRIDCSNPSLPIRGSWSVIEGVQSSSNPAVKLTPPLSGTPSITYTSAGDLSGSAVFVPNSSYVLEIAQGNEEYTFNVTVTNVAGGSSFLLPDFRIAALCINDSTVAMPPMSATFGCLTVNLGPACRESISNGNFTVMLVYGVGNCETVDDLMITTTVNRTINDDGVCISVGTRSASELCFRATLLYNGIEIQNLSNEDFRQCQLSDLQGTLSPGVTLEQIPENNMIRHLMKVNLACSKFVFILTEPSQPQCVNGNWTPDGSSSSCSFPTWLIVILILIFAFTIGVVLGVVLAATCLKNLVAALSDRRCWAIILILCLCILGVGIGILMYTCYSRCKDTQKKKSKTSDEDGLTRSTSSPLPPDSLYADPKSIEHEAAPGTEDQYAMVDVKGKKNTKPKPTPPEALYQDPSTIEHETAVSGDTYAVVDKPKRSSKKKGGPDVIPPASEGLTYADIGLSTKRPKPGSDQQAAQQPGEYPVEYSSVEHGSTS